MISYIFERLEIRLKACKLGHEFLDMPQDNQVIFTFSL